MTQQPVARAHIDGARCVHGLCAMASCQRCVAACPRHAITLTPTALAIDEAACDGCGLCRPACPENAVDVTPGPLQPLVVPPAREVLAACEKAGVTGAAGVVPGVVPCLHALGERDVAAWAAQGAEVVVVASGDCGRCPRNTSATLDKAAERVSRVRRSRGAAAVRIMALPAQSWSARRASRRTDLDQGRRGFLSLFVAVGGGRAGRAPTSPSPGPSDELFLHAPAIDVDRCRGCDACARICPHDAIALARTERGLHYRIAAGSCTGCAMCVDVCPDTAVSVRVDATCEQPLVPLLEQRCPRCGVLHHPPAATSPPGGVCAICRAKPAHGVLFQVRRD